MSKLQLQHAMDQAKIESLQASLDSLRKEELA